VKPWEETDAQRLAAQLRQLADELESGGWSAATFEVLNQYTDRYDERGRFRGKARTGQTGRIYLDAPNRGGDR